jgi:hypothetical protein
MHTPHSVTDVNSGDGQQFSTTHALQRTYPPKASYHVVSSTLCAREVVVNHNMAVELDRARVAWQPSQSPQSYQQHSALTTSCETDDLMGSHAPSPPLQTTVPHARDAAACIHIVLAAAASCSELPNTRNLFSRHRDIIHHHHVKLVEVATYPHDPQASVATSTHPAACPSCY